MNENFEISNLLCGRWAPAAPAGCVTAGRNGWRGLECTGEGCSEGNGWGGGAGLRGFDWTVAGWMC